MNCNENVIYYVNDKLKDSPDYIKNKVLSNFIALNRNGSILSNNCFVKQIDNGYYSIRSSTETIYGLSTSNILDLYKRQAEEDIIIEKRFRQRQIEINSIIKALKDQSIHAEKTNQ